MMRRWARLGCGMAALGLAACQTMPVEESSPVPEAKPNNELAELQTQLGIGYLRQGKLELAWKRLHKALEVDPNYSTAHNAMGLLYERLGQPTEAEAHYVRAISLNPSDSSAQNNYGRFLCTHGRTEEGEARFLAALKNSLYATPEVAYTNAGLCMKTAGDLDKAERYLRAALETNPRIPTALVAMSEVSYDKAHYLPARAYLQRYLEVGEHTPQTLWLGIRIERELGDRNTASSYAMLLKANYPDSLETQLLLDSSGQ